MEQSIVGHFIELKVWVRLSECMNEREDQRLPVGTLRLQEQYMLLNAFKLVICLTSVLFLK